jgi:hypothetical protein
MIATDHDWRALDADYVSCARCSAAPGSTAASLPCGLPIDPEDLDRLDALTDALARAVDRLRIALYHPPSGF